MAGLLADHVGTAAPVLFAAATATGAGILQLLLIRPTPPPTDDPGTIRAVLRVRGAWPAAVIVLLGAGVLAVVEPVLPLRLAASGVSSSHIGVIFATAVLAGAVVTPWAGSLVTRIQPAAPVMAGILLSAAALLVLAHTHTIGMILIAMAALGAGSALLLGSIMPVPSIFGEQTTPSTLGAVFARANLAYAAGLLLGPGSSGPLTGVASYPAALPSPQQPSS